MFGADRFSRDNALVGVGRWHPDVHDSGIRLTKPDLPHQPVAIRSLTDDLDARLSEHVDDPLPGQLPPSHTRPRPIL
jgi:hypothetical protein